MTPPRGTVVTVGTFDGVHRGHRAVLDEIARRATASGRRSLLVTFEPHPLEVVNPGAAPPLLTTGLEKREILAQCPVDAVAFVAFTRALALTAPEDFVRGILRERFRMEELVIGHDHGFGRGRQGDVSMLRRLGAEDGFEVDVVDEVDVDGKSVSSTLIRRAVAGGDLEHAARWLGRRYSASGVVQRGVGRGRELGVPTINLAMEDPRKLLPPDGVYAVWVEWRRGRHGGMLNLGPRPTFGDMERQMEAHLFDFDGSLYGQLVKVEFVDRLRSVERFASPEALRDQLTADRQAAERALTEVTTSH